MILAHLPSQAGLRFAPGALSLRLNDDDGATVENSKQGLQPRIYKHTASLPPHLWRPQDKHIRFFTAFAFQLLTVLTYRLDRLTDLTFFFDVFFGREEACWIAHNLRVTTYAFTHVVFLSVRRRGQLRCSSLRTTEERGGTQAVLWTLRRKGTHRT